MNEIIMTDDLLKEMSNFNSRKDVADFIKKYKSLEYLPILIMNFAEELNSCGKRDIANLIYLEIADNNELEYIYDEITLYLRLGEYYINCGEMDHGKEYLIKLCNQWTNYEDAIEFRELTEVWQKLKAYVIDEIKPSVSLNETAEDMDSMTDDELLDLLLSELASGGIHAWLSYYGNTLEKTLAAAKNREKHVTAELLEVIKVKYFNSNIPENVTAIENILLENDWWFEEEYDKYYYEIEKELC